MRKFLFLLLFAPLLAFGASVDDLKNLLNQTTTAKARFAQAVLDRNNKTLQQVTGTMEFSPRWKSMLGLGPDEIGSDRAAWLARVHADDRAGLEAALARHLDGSEARFEHEMRLLHRDGNVRNVLSRGIALRDESGKPSRMVGLDTDVTRLKRVQTVLDAVAEGTAGAFGDEFFRAMVRHFARALEVDRAFITECADDPVTRVRTLAVWSANGGHTDNFEYALDGTPCADVLRSDICWHVQGVQR